MARNEYASELADTMGKGEPLFWSDVYLCQKALVEYDMNRSLWHRYGHFALALAAGLALGSLATIGVERARAGEVHCSHMATGATVCDDGVRVTPTATGTKIERPGQRHMRCARTPVGVACRED